MSVTVKPTEVPAFEAMREEHIDPVTHAQAAELIARAGGPEAAKFAIDAAKTAAPPTGATEDELAKHWGFASYLELFEAARPTHNSQGQTWMIAATAQHQYLVWCDGSLDRGTILATQQEARDFAERA